MSQHEAELIAALPLSECKFACQKAIEQLGWKIQDGNDAYFKVKEGIFSSGFAGNPVTLEISLEDQSPRETRIIFQSSNLGFGSINTNRCKKAINSAIEQIKLASMPFVAMAEGLVCPTCGKLLPPGARFCDKDGTPILRVCPSCNASNTPGAQFCANCGERI